MTSTPESPNVWVDCDCGERHWGRYGAAGLLLLHRTAVNTNVTNTEAGSPAPPGRPSSPELLLQLRAGWTHHGGTWALPGGARGADETAEQAALREAEEEAGLSASGLRIGEQVRHDHGTWSYTYVLAEIDGRPELTPADDETEGLAWVPVDQVAEYPLHPHFAAAWPGLLDRVQRLVRSS